jgi:hypothetical protein
MCLRLVVVLCPTRLLPEQASLRLSHRSGTFKFIIDPGGSRRCPPSAWFLGKEVLAWKKTTGSSAQTSAERAQPLALALALKPRSTAAQASAP